MLRWLRGHCLLTDRVDFLCAVGSMRTSTRRAAGSRRPRDVQSSLSSNYDSVFVHRKNALYRRAAELSAITDCEISIIVLSPDGELSQFSTAPMKKILRSYSRLCSSPHEIHNMESIQKKLVSAGGEGVGLLTQDDGGVQKKQKPKPKKKAAQKNKVDVNVVEDDLEDAGEMIEAILAMRGSALKEEPVRDGEKQENQADGDDDKGTGPDTDDTIEVENMIDRSDTVADSSEKRQEESGDGEVMHGKKRPAGEVHESGNVQKKHRLSKVDFSKEIQSLKPMDEKKKAHGDDDDDSPTRMGADVRGLVGVGTPLNKKQKPLPPSVDPIPLLGPEGRPRIDS